MLKTRVMLVFCLGVAACATAQTSEQYSLTGRVSNVLQGDLLQVTDERGRRFNVRLIGIDAPQKDVEDAKNSTNHLKVAVLGKDVEVLWTHKDAQGRLLGSVRINGGSVNLSQIEHGYARYNPLHEPYLEPYVQSYYRDAQEKARKYRLGLWRPQPLKIQS